MQSITECLTSSDQHTQPLRIIDVADLPTRSGNFKIIAFDGFDDKKEHVAIIHGDLFEAKNILVRIHSECLTGDVMGSLRCDCREQLENALQAIGQLEDGAGIIIYLRQEGRGIGLTNKIKAYALQDQGLDTFEANRALGFMDDGRNFYNAAAILKMLGVSSIKLMTNNPKKIEDLAQHGITVSERIPHVVKPNKHNCQYLTTKQTKGGHLNLLDLAVVS